MLLEMGTRWLLSIAPAGSVRSAPSGRAYDLCSAL